MCSKWLIPQRDQESRSLMTCRTVPTQICASRPQLWDAQSPASLGLSCLNPKKKRERDISVFGLKAEVLWRRMTM